MSKFKTGDLVRYVRFAQADDEEWRMSRIGLILSKTNLRNMLTKKSISTATVMYNVIWNDDTRPLIVPEQNLELVLNEI